MIAQKKPNMENISVVTTGGLPPNPAELLGSARMDHILEEAEKVADVVILDSPPSLVADVQILAAKVDGVILVIHPGHTQADSAQAAMEQLRRAGARVIGVVLNRIPRHRAEYYGGYSHYSPYYSGYQYEAGEPTSEDEPSVLKRLFTRHSVSGNGHKKIVQETHTNSN